MFLCQVNILLRWPHLLPLSYNWEGSGSRCSSKENWRFCSLEVRLDGLYTEEDCDLRTLIALSYCGVTLLGLAFWHMNRLLPQAAIDWFSIWAERGRMGGVGRTGRWWGRKEDRLSLGREWFWWQQSPPNANPDLPSLVQLVLWRLCSWYRYR